jgi:hypothetical protein
MKEGQSSKQTPYFIKVIPATFHKVETQEELKLICNYLTGG